MAICDWPADERPREKLLARGAQVLSDAELLAIFLRTGTSGLSAVDLARQLLVDFGGLRQIVDASRAQFCAGRGLGDAKYAQLQAVLEMARRHLAEQLRRDSVLDSPAAVRQFLSSKLRARRQEVFAALFLDSQNRLLLFEEMFYGSVASASVYPRELVRRALELNASALIVCHNHPSGVTEASTSDRRITERIEQALALVDVALLDHLIIGEGEALSFAERGWL